MKAYKRGGYGSTYFSLDTRCGVSNRLHPGCFTPGMHWIGASVGAEIGLNAIENRKICCNWRESKIDSSDVQAVDCSCTD
jgi:hypothetical protein